MLVKKTLSPDQVPMLIEDRVKVQTNYNPFQSRRDSVWVDVSRLEDIIVYHRRIKETRRLIDILKDQALKKRIRKRVAKDVLKHWDKEFMKIYKSERHYHFDRAAALKSKKFRSIAIKKIFLFGGLTLFFLVLSFRWAFLSNLPLLGRLFSYIYRTIDEPHWNNVLVLLTYVSLISTLYYLVLRTYYSLMRDLGAQAEGYVRKSFRKIKRRYRDQYRELKRHLLKLVRSKYYRKTFRMKQIYDSQEALRQLNDYLTYLTDRVRSFQRQDILLQLGGMLCHLVVFGGLAYFLIGIIFFL